MNVSFSHVLSPHRNEFNLFYLISKPCIAGLTLHPVILYFYDADMYFSCFAMYLFGRHFSFVCLFD